jgi:hypothetical protein
VRDMLDEMIGEGNTREQAYAKLALTAKVVDPDHPLWVKNKHGVYFSSVYGFGKADKGKAKGITIDGEYKNVTAMKEVNKSIPYATKLAKEIIKVSDSGIKGITYLSFSFHTNHLHNSAMHVKITSPNGTAFDVFLGSATEGHYPGYDYEYYFENPYKFSTRAFLGESADGEWTVEFGHGGFVPLSHYVNPTLTIHGFTNSLPEADQFIDETQKRTISGTVEQTNLKCNAKIEGLGDTKAYYIVENVGERYRKRSLPKIGGNFVIPCIYKNNINLLITDKSYSVIKNYTVDNQHDFPKVTNMDPYSEIRTNSPNKTFRYVRQDEHLSPLEEHAYVTVTIYDQHLRRLRYMGSFEDTGEITINFENHEIFKRAVLTIQPQQIVDYCDIVLLPFRYLEDSTTYKFDVFVNEDKCMFSKSNILVELPRRLRPLDHRGRRAFLIGFFVPFTTVFATIIASLIWYLVVARKAAFKPTGELGNSFIP